MSRINIFNLNGPGISYLDAQNDLGSGADGNIKRAEWYEWSVTLADATTEVNRGSLYKFIVAHESLISTEAAAQGLGPLEEGVCRFFCSGTSNEDLLKYLKLVEKHLTPIDAVDPNKNWARLQGEADFAAGKYTHASLHLKTVKDSDIQHVRGYSYVQAGNQAKGAKILQKVNSSSIACEEAAQLYTTLGNPSMAAVMKAKKEIIDSGKPFSYDEGRAAYIADNHWVAIAHLDSLDDKKSLFMTGVSYYQVDQMETAIEFLKKSIAKGYTDAYTWLGHCHYALRDDDLAWECYNEGHRKGSVEALESCITCIQEGIGPEKDNQILLKQLEAALAVKQAMK